MMSENALDALCRLCGIEPHFTDIWGKVHHISHDATQVLLAAMGIDIATTPVESLLAQQSARPWRRWLDPVQVVRDPEAPIAITLRLPQSDADKTYEWSLICEDGHEWRGSWRPSELVPEGQRDVDGTPYAAFQFDVPERPGIGYHRFELRCDDRHENLSLIVAPTNCYLPQAVTDEGRVWGPALQLYALRSRRNWGIGDFTDLRWALEHFAERGAGVVGLNPLHALFPHNPEHASPYSPSSRLFLNVLYIDVEAIPEFAECEAAHQTVYAREFQARLEELRSAELVDYPRVAAAKSPVLETLYLYFREHHLNHETARGQAFRAFQAEGGELLYRHALYEALQEHLHRADPAIWGWPVWPSEYHDPTSEAAAAFGERERVRVEFYQYLQWQADQQLGTVGRRSAALGLGVGLYQDLAISVDPAGAEAWALQSLYAQNVSVGSPPDDFNMKGQKWGLPPLVPQRLTEAAYVPFIATLRENMRHAGALRIDHVMGLMRLYWVPDGRSAEEGAYVRYPFSDLLGILALESQRNQCMVIGEDLGTVPDEVREALAPMNVLSYRLLYFERDEEGELQPPPAYPMLALAAVSTHDLPTLTGYWKGQDLLERFELKLFPAEEAYREQVMTRTQDRARLLMALAREELLPKGLTVDPASSPEMTPELARALHLYVARTPAKIMMVQLEDVVGQLRQVNLPATSHERPNWRIKLVEYLEEMMVDARVRVLFTDLRELRGSGIVTPPTPEVEPVFAIPCATYRLQFHRDFTFTAADGLTPYLSRLGISHCYASPYLKARPGSRHGYDIVDHNSLNPEIGSVEDYARWVETLHRHRMGQILDIVPNHMAVGSDNVWWLDVLENGPASFYAEFFDIDWLPLKSDLRDKVLLPVLGDHYGKVLEAGELRLAFESSDGVFHVRYYEHHFPIDPNTYPQILEQSLDRLESNLGAEHPRFLEYQSLVAAFRHLPRRNQLSLAQVGERHRDKEVHKKRLADLCAAVPEIGRHVEEAVALYNGTDETHERPDLLHQLLETQAYRVAYWRVAADEINYRRFFDINDLAGLRMENPQVFFATHRLISELVAQGKVNGLRIDHPDGLYNPVEYYHRLQAFVTEAIGAEQGAARKPDAAVGDRPLYVLVEKILAGYEHLSNDWPVHGTTGYEFANLVNGLFVYPTDERKLERLYQRFIGRSIDFDELLYERKKLIMRVALSSELHVLANKLNRISESEWHARDYTLTALHNALIEVVACFPVYRTYVTGEHVSHEDRRYVDWAVAQAIKRSPAGDISIYEFIRNVLLLEGLEERPESYRRALADFAMRFQQYTAPVMAKGLEDTSFYIYNRLVSLNEVGGDPRRFGLSIAAFHHANNERAQRWPYALLSTSTHDSKRSEDVRARINVLSELVEEWKTRLAAWSRFNRHKKRKLDDGTPVPGRNDEYLLYQTLIGAWPLEELDDNALMGFRERIQAYMLKAVREAKVHTSWINPNREYEEAVAQFVTALLSNPANNLFLSDFLPFQRRVSRFGQFNSLSQTLLKLTAPGVPDIYQGNELWDYSLVDPDNRRPVDYARREALLSELESFDQKPNELPARVRGLLDTLDDGRAKLYLIWRTLTQRRTQPLIFRNGTYQPLTVDGAKADQVCAFARLHERQAVIVVAPCWFAQLLSAGQALPLDTAVWDGHCLELPVETGIASYINVLTGERLEVEQRDDRPVLQLDRLLVHFPVALMRGDEN